ncbi:uncharacterized protein Z520_05291 [Fonsecaea multimorphosa CBS 102226]|uniref:DUF1746 domain-containing protein n=1 Tax=Fonsecaea multimorphosa CBS 102226 TaxID=1442371 RepID=A0A0D2HAD1_9EURO|nr:uncharacterized protein Z520_05291 [Fonsecaea multimorphosa CBS 102226]KIX98830.1 hypothetical protein Z520_05291 [Fonsecaea multimorphosa CBS 102226]OAL25110.1 hypothetical protein AYO22_04987 [Fonsecaea multimorphosa]
MNNTADNDGAFVPSLTLDRRLEIPDQKKHYLDSLLRLLDALIFLHLGILYICDNLTFLLVLRALNQVVHVQHRPATITPVIVVNLICVVTHLLQSRSGTKRLHGGIIVDFVGEIPRSRTYVLILDLILFSLQLVMLVAGHERQIASGEVPALQESQPQDLESEEAGQLRSRAQEQVDVPEEGIELQSLLPEGSGEDGATHQKQDEVTQDDDMILLDLKKGVKALFSRPMPVASPTAIENAQARASVAAFLRLAAARARAG